MGRRGSGEDDTHGQWQMGRGLRQKVLQGTAGCLEGGRHVVVLTEFYIQLLPAHHVDFQKLDVGDLVGLRRDQQGTACALLADVPPLDVAGKGDDGLARLPMFGKDAALMHMAQRPVLVALGFQFGNGAGRIGGVFGIAFQGRVQHADVQPARDRFRIIRNHIFRGGFLLEASAMNRHLQ